MSFQRKTLSIIKPDAVERNLSEKIKSIFTKNNLTNFKYKKNFIFQKTRLQSFIRYINQNHFMINFVVIYLLDQ